MARNQDIDDDSEDRDEDHEDEDGSLDETGDERLTIDYYSDGDHVSTQKVDAYTRHFYETHRELFQ